MFFAVIFCVFFQSFILCLVFIGCGKNRFLSKNGKKDPAKKAQRKVSTPNKNHQQQQQLQRSRASQPLQQQQQQQQRERQSELAALQRSQSDASQQRIKEGERKEVKKEEPPSNKQQKPQQNVEAQPIQAAPPQHPVQPPIVESPVPSEKDEDLCCDTTPPELKALLQELECH